MTADNPADYPYRAAMPLDGNAQQRATHWAVASGLQAVDGLVTSEYASALMRDYVSGTRELANIRELVENRYRSVTSPEPAACAAEPAASASEPETSESPSTHAPEAQREADLVALRITELLARNAFLFEPRMLQDIHRHLFQDMDAEAFRPGQWKTEALQKQEAILNGDSVVYADPSLIGRALDFAFDEERAFAYAPIFDAAQLEHFARFAARIWQVHPFAEGNTRTTAVFLVLYLRDLGFDAENEPFEHHSRYFRDALVRANYRNARAGAMPDLQPLTRFFDNLLAGAHHELHSEDLHVQPLFDDPTLLRNIPPEEAISQPR